MEPMNATLSHAKIRVTTSLSAPVFVAGDEVTGKIELDCRTDKGLGISTIMVELIAVQELTSRDHSATSTFMAAKRLFQGPGLPPSNAVFAHPQPGVPALPLQFHQARKGCTTFFFNFPLPQSSPNSISFGNGLARVFYEIRATVNIFWKGERTTVRNNKEVTIVECLVESRIPKEPFTLVAEGGKMVVQAQVVGGIGVTGQPACVELQVKNHSQKKTSSLNLTLTRTLHLPGIGTLGNPFQVTDTVVTVPFRGPEYTITPGVEGVANLVFDIPRTARGVKGGTREWTDDGDHKHIEALFDVRTSITIAIGMGVGSKDIKIEVPLVIVHPSAVPEAWNDPYAAFNSVPPPEFVHGPLEPPRLPYAMPSSSSGSPSPVLYPPPGPLQYQHTATPPNSFGSVPPTSPVPVYPNYYSPHVQPYYGPSSADPAYYFPPPPMPGIDHFAAPGGMPPMMPHSFGDISSPYSMPNLPPAPATVRAVGNDGAVVPVEGHTEEGKGERASRISLHLRVSSRNRSVSPTSHRYRITGASAPAEDPNLSASFNETPQKVPVIDTTDATIKQSSPEIRSPRPMPSPKASFYGAPIPSFGQSGRVAALEMMAAEVGDDGRRGVEPVAGAPKRESSPAHLMNALPEEHELEAAELVDILGKTLPIPPVSSKRRLSELPPASAPNLFSVFSASKQHKPVAVGSEAPQVPLDSERKETQDIPRPITTLANIGKRGEASAENIAEISDEKGPLSVGDSLKSPKGQTTTNKESAGLEALERRLLKEVGTRKQPDAVLNHLREMEKATTAAIQQKVAAKRTLGLEPHRKPPDGSVAATVTPSEDKEAAIHVLLNRKRRKTFDQEPRLQDAGANSSSQKDLPKQEEEALKLRRAAKGRVAAWLGAAQTAEPPPPSETRIVEQAILETVAATVPTKEIFDITTGSQKASASEPDTVPKQRVDPSKIQLPGRRSSGFAPISRLNVQTVTVQTNKDNILAQPAKTGLLPPSRTSYDVRSARGGRGGVVTSVAALWADKVKVETTSPPPSAQKERVPLPADKKEALANLRLRSPVLEDNPKPKLKSSPLKPPPAKVEPPLESIKETEAAPPSPWFKVAITAARSAPGYLGIKSTSVPAKLSSSIATPMLSSTASLARPQPKALSPVGIGPKLHDTRATNPIVSGAETRADPRQVAAKVVPTVSIGQGRLKDLIAKYQGTS